jgi:methylated-DNA-[protein]-cysteine S-methyltransferase
MLFTSKFPSPIGSLRFISTEANLKQIILPTQSLSSRLSHDLDSKEIPILLKCAEQLEEYFTGKRKVFSLPLEPEGTSFQVKAWMALRTINYGETATYGQQAKVVGAPNGARPGRQTP